VGFTGHSPVVYELSFETKESGLVEGHFAVPTKSRIEGRWSLQIGKGGSLVLRLKGSTLGGTDLNWGIPIERRAGERSFSGRDDSGNYYRLEWLRREKPSGDRF
jgi:hypothetical protein